MAELVARARGSPTAPPPGVTPDYYHSASIGYEITIASLVSIILATTAVVARLGVKYFITHAPGWDDCK